MLVNSPSRLLRLLTLLVSVTVLIGCGDGRGQDPVPGTPQPTLTGVLVDSPVSGVTWKTSGGGSGLTNDSGEFFYVQPESGTFIETVTFSIGDIVLGTVPGAPFVTAVELTASFAPTDRAATNQLVFIQSIDSDGDPSNGITISEATRTAAVGQTLDFDSPDFATEVVDVVAAIAPGNAVVTDTAALDQFYATYAALGGTDTFDFGFPGYPPVGEGAADFVLVFADEFDVGDQPDPQVWNIDLGYGPNNSGWGNNEWQLYTDSPDNLRIEDGNLVITALCPVEPCGVRDGTITSARITTNDKFEFKYGKVVARIKMPVGQGTWPAFWSLGKDFPDVQWPRVGEIDFVEVFNNTYNSTAESVVAEKTTTSAMHWCDEFIVSDPNANCFPAGRIFVSDKLETPAPLDQEFHIWEADWTADKVTVKFDGIEYFELDIDPATMEEFRREFFLLLNLAMGGTLGSGGQPPQGDETFPQTMLVDYVRVFQQVDDISPPELTTVTIASDNVNPAFAKTGDTVTVTFTSNEPIATPIVTIGGIAATDVTGSGTDWQASRALTTDDADGVVEFTVEYTDVNGNAGVPAFATTDASRVTADSVVPVLTTVTIASSNANPSLATTGDVMTVTLTADETIDTPTVTIGGVAAAVVGSGANWQASRAVTIDDVDGVISFSIAYADFAGNAGAPVSTTTDASAVTVSTNAPEVTIEGAPAMFMTLAPISVSFTFRNPETQAEVSVTGFDVGDIAVTNGGARNLVVVSGSTYTADIVPNGIGDLVVGVPAGAAADATGNTNTAAANVTVTGNLDVNAPLLNPISIASNNANAAFARTGDVVTISMTASEAITQPTVTIAGAPAAVMMGADATSWVATRTMLAADPEGPIDFVIDNFQAADDATPGYQSTVPTDGSAVIFDVTAPTLSIIGLPADVQFLEPIPTTFQFDEDVSGFDSNGIQVTNGIAAAFTAVDAATYTADIIPSGAGDLTVAVAADVAADAAGNGNVAASETSVVGPAWQLVWSDNFDVDGLNPARWTARITEVDCPDPCDGVQRYRQERVTVAGGLLTIEARDEGGFSSGIVDTKGNLEFTYGRVEIDARMPGTQGTLPSLRLLPAVPGGEVVPNYGPWPQSGEVDIVNAPNLGPSNSSLDHTLIYGLPEPENTSTTANSVAPGLPTVDIIQYAIEWEGGEIRWFVNDVHVATQTQDNWYAYFQDADGNGSFDADGPFTLGTGAAPFDDNFYLVIGLAVGNNADSFFPQTLEIDAVRVYDCANPTDPLLGTGCSTGTGVPAENAPAAPYTEMLEIYTDAPATLDFLEPDGVNTVTATLTPFAFQGDPSVVVSSVPNAPDGGNTVWRVDVQAPIGTFGSALMAADNVSASISSSRYLDLSGGGTAGEILFRMRVNSASAGARLEAGLVDRPDNPGVVSLDFVADGQWRDYSVKIVDIVSNSIAAGPSIDLADIFGVFVAGLDGTVNFDLDDISITVACRDVGGCEATPRAEDSAPPIVVFSEDFESLDASNAAALGPFGAGWQIFADVWDGEVGVPANFKYQYGPFAAPNPGAGPGFSQLINDINECFAGGGTQCLNAFSDYNNQDHGPSGACSPNSCAINTNVLKDLRDLSNPITAADIGLCWTFSGDYKAPGAGGIGGATTANAFITTLDPNDNFAATNVDRFDTTAASNTEFARFSVDVDTADSALIGQLLQIGFNTTATNFEPSGVYYDNLEVSTRAGACPADP